jgi:hypothetical protein
MLGDTLLLFETDIDPVSEPERSIEIEDLADTLRFGEAEAESVPAAVTESTMAAMFRLYVVCP